jgi:hypothetical protein
VPISEIIQIAEKFLIPGIEEIIFTSLEKGIASS